MSGNRIILLVLVGSFFALLVISNLSSPPLPLVFLGIQTPALPLTVWIGGAIAFGAITSFVLQFLSYLQISDGIGQKFQRVSPKRRPVVNERFASEKTETQPPNNPPSPPNSKTNSASDWDVPAGPDWNFDGETTPPGSRPEDSNKNYEMNQQPANSSKTGSVYSYSYRETSKSGVGKADTVYDANYRVITPPHQKTPVPTNDNDNEDEDWGFDDDEDFDFNDRQEGKTK